MTEVAKQNPKPRDVADLQDSLKPAAELPAIDLPIGDAKLPDYESLDLGAGEASDLQSKEPDASHLVAWQAPAGQQGTGKQGTGKQGTGKQGTGKQGTGAGTQKPVVAPKPKPKGQGLGTAPPPYDPKAVVALKLQDFERQRLQVDISIVDVNDTASFERARGSKLTDAERKIIDLHREVIRKGNDAKPGTYLPQVVLIHEKALGSKATGAGVLPKGEITRALRIRRTDTPVNLPDEIVTGMLTNIREGAVPDVRVHYGSKLGNKLNDFGGTNGYKRDNGLVAEHGANCFFAVKLVFDVARDTPFGRVKNDDLKDPKNPAKTRPFWVTIPVDGLSGDITRHMAWELKPNVVTPTVGGLQQYHGNVPSVRRDKDTNQINGVQTNTAGLQEDPVYTDFDFNAWAAPLLPTGYTISKVSVHSTAKTIDGEKIGPQRTSQGYMVPFTVDTTHTIQVKDPKDPTKMIDKEVEESFSGRFMAGEFHEDPQTKIVTFSATNMENSTCYQNRPGSLGQFNYNPGDRFIGRVEFLGKHHDIKP